MRAIIASGNIFRRELSVYVLHDAGFAIEEVSNTDELLTRVQETAPDIALLDTALVEDPCHALANLRQLTNAPILWIDQVGKLPTTPSNPDHRVGCIRWPYHPNELISYVKRLMQ